MESRLRSRSRKTGEAVPSREVSRESTDQSGERRDVVGRKRPATKGNKSGKKKKKKRRTAPNPPATATVLGAPRTTEASSRVRNTARMSTGGRRLNNARIGVRPSRPPDNETTQPPREATRQVVGTSARMQTGRASGDGMRMEPVVSLVRLLPIVASIPSAESATSGRDVMPPSSVSVARAVPDNPPAGPNPPPRRTTARMSTGGRRPTATRVMRINARTRNARVQPRVATPPPPPPTSPPVRQRTTARMRTGRHVTVRPLSVPAAPSDRDAPASRSDVSLRSESLPSGNDNGGGEAVDPGQDNSDDDLMDVFDEEPIEYIDNYIEDPIVLDYDDVVPLDNVVPLEDVEEDLLRFVSSRIQEFRLSLNIPGAGQAATTTDFVHRFGNLEFRFMTTIRMVDRGSGLSTEDINRLPTRLFQGDDGGNSSQTQCLICLAEYQYGDRLRTLTHSCPHQFHATCVDTWLEANTTCPICRTAVRIP